MTTFDQLAPEKNAQGRQPMHVRRHFDIGAFGCNAYRAEEGKDVIPEHDELGATAGGHEELYVVVSGRATFTLDGEEIDAPAGALVFVRDPAVKRKATALESGTTVFAVGGKPGAAFTPSAWEAMSDMWPPYYAGDYEAALDVLRASLEQYPGNSTILFNVACCESLLGRTDDALEHLAEAVEDERMRKLATTDTDLDAIRADPRFAELVPEAD
jgi:tetratricopeptide (TPR) repeat protein